MAKRKSRPTPTPRQRRIAMIVGTFLVALACVLVLAETIINEGGSPLTVVIVALALFLVFVLPILLALRDARRRTAIR